MFTRLPAVFLPGFSETWSVSDKIKRYEGHGCQMHIEDFTELVAPHFLCIGAW